MILHARVPAHFLVETERELECVRKNRKKKKIRFELDQSKKNRLKNHLMEEEKVKMEKGELKVEKRLKVLFANFLFVISDLLKVKKLEEWETELLWKKKQQRK